MRIMIAGTLHDTPETRTSKNGNPFTVAKIKSDTTPPTWASIVCFGEQADTLAKMLKGAALAVSGKGTVDVYHPATGEPRANISITADQIITLKKPGKVGNTKGNTP